jgi:transposase
MFIMESVGKKKRRPRRVFTPEFKAEIVGLCRQDDGRSIAQVAADFDLTDSAVRSWVEQADADDRAGARSEGQVGSGRLSSHERAELAALRSENRRLREDNEVLKRATAFFAREIR